MKGSTIFAPIPFPGQCPREFCESPFLRPISSSSQMSTSRQGNNCLDAVIYKAAIIIMPRGYFSTSSDPSRARLLQQQTTTIFSKGAMKVGWRPKELHCPCAPTDIAARRTRAWWCMVAGKCEMENYIIPKVTTAKSKRPDAAATATQSNRQIPESCRYIPRRRQREGWKRAASANRPL
jgi:hypothetical protein